MGKHKKEHGKSRLGMFIQKAGAIFPDILQAGVMLGSGNVMGAIQQVASGLGANIDNMNPGLREDAKILMQEFELKKEEMALESFRIEAQDAQNARDNETARDTSEHAGWLSKNIHEIIALAFVFGWFAVLGWTINLFIKDVITVNQLVLILAATGLKDMVLLILGYLYGRTRPQK